MNDGEGDTQIIPSVVNTSSSVGNASRTREEVAFHNTILCKGGCSTSTPVYVLRTCASFEDDPFASRHRQLGVCTENKDGIGDGTSVTHPSIQDEIT